MSAIHNMVDDLDRIIKEHSILPAELADPVVRQLVTQLLVSDYISAATLAINLKIALTKEA